MQKVVPRPSLKHNNFQYNKMTKNIEDCSFQWMPLLSTNAAHDSAWWSFPPYKVAIWSIQIHQLCVTGISLVGHIWIYMIYPWWFSGGSSQPLASPRYLLNPLLLQLYLPLTSKWHECPNIFIIRKFVSVSSISKYIKS